MNSDQLEQHSKRVIEVLESRDIRFAVVGGIAVSFHTIERLTKDIDFAVVVRNDAGAESLVLEFSQHGYFVSELIEHETQGSPASAH